MILGHRYGKKHENDSRVIQIPPAVLSAETILLNTSSYNGNMKGLILTPGLGKI